jgi:hypothetical protein
MVSQNKGEKWTVNSWQMQFHVIKLQNSCCAEGKD